MTARKTETSTKKGVEQMTARKTETSTQKGEEGDRKTVTLSTEKGEKGVCKTEDTKYKGERGRWLQY